MHLQKFLLLTLLLTLTQAGVAESKPLKVFVLAGQSNMQGHAHVRTLEHLSMDAATTGMLAKILDSDGVPRTCDQTWISNLSSNGVKSGPLTTGFGADDDKIGPELSFGISIQESLKQPVLIIKTAWGGKSLNTDFRSPSAGPYKFNADQLASIQKQQKDVEAIKQEKLEATGAYYRLMMEHIQEVLANIETICPDYTPTQGYELAGFVWFQGWNDMVDGGTYPTRDKTGGYDQYSELLSHLIRDVRKDLTTPDLPFVVGVLGVGGPVAEYGPDQRRYATIHQNFRDAMAAPAKLPEFRKTVANVLTENYWDRELSELRARESQMKKKLKALRSEGKLNGQNDAEALNALHAEAFSKRERRTLDVGISNAEYHYLGSAKIMTQIGQAFAEAMIKLSDR